MNIAYYGVHAVNVNSVHSVNILGQPGSHETIFLAVNSGADASVVDAAAFDVGSDDWGIFWWTLTRACAAFILRRFAVSGQSALSAKFRAFTARSKATRPALMTRGLADVWTWTALGVDFKRIR